MTQGKTTPSHGNMSVPHVSVKALHKSIRNSNGNSNLTQLCGLAEKNKTKTKNKLTSLMHNITSFYTNETIALRS